MGHLPLFKDFCPGAIDDLRAALRTGDESFRHPSHAAAAAATAAAATAAAAAATDSSWQQDRTGCMTGRECVTGRARDACHGTGRDV